MLACPVVRRFKGKQVYSPLPAGERVGGEGIFLVGNGLRAVPKAKHLRTSERHGGRSLQRHPAPRSLTLTTGERGGRWCHPMQTDLPGRGGVRWWPTAVGGYNSPSPVDPLEEAT